MSKRATLEKRMRVYDDDTGEYVEVTEDADCLCLIEILQPQTKQRITLTIEQARLLCLGIEEVAQHIEKREKPKP
jgi:hypothetical protein